MTRKTNQCKGPRKIGIATATGNQGQAFGRWMAAFPDAAIVRAPGEVRKGRLAEAAALGERSPGAPLCYPGFEDGLNVERPTQAGRCSAAEGVWATPAR